MYRSGRSAWCTNAELSDPADSETTKEAPHGKYVLHRLRCSQEIDQLLRERCERSNSCARQDCCHALRPGRVDENASRAVDGSNGSHYVHGLDLRSSEAPRRGAESGPSTDAAGHRCGKKEE